MDAAQAASVSPLNLAVSCPRVLLVPSKRNRCAPRCRRYLSPCSASAGRLCLRPSIRPRSVGLAPGSGVPSPRRETVLGPGRGPAVVARADKGSGPRSPHVGQLTTRSSGQNAGRRFCTRVRRYCPAVSPLNLAVIPLEAIAAWLKSVCTAESLRQRGIISRPAVYSEVQHPIIC